MQNTINTIGSDLNICVQPLLLLMSDLCVAVEETWSTRQDILELTIK